MKCPFRIEPHQIQGLDYIHIFPVIQWLVKRAIETRAEMGDMNRAFALSQFEKYVIIRYLFYFLNPRNRSKWLKNG